MTPIEIREHRAALAELRRLTVFGATETEKTRVRTLQQHLCEAMPRLLDALTAHVRDEIVENELDSGLRQFPQPATMFGRPADDWFDVKRILMLMTARPQASMREQMLMVVKTQGRDIDVERLGPYILPSWPFDVITVLPLYEGHAAARCRWNPSLGLYDVIALGDVRESVTQFRGTNIPRASLLTAQKDAEYWAHVTNLRIMPPAELSR